MKFEGGNTRKKDTKFSSGNTGKKIRKYRKRKIVSGDDNKKMADNGMQTGSENGNYSGYSYENRVNSSPQSGSSTQQERDKNGKEPRKRKPLRFLCFLLILLLLACGVTSYAYPPVRAEVYARTGWQIYAPGKAKAKETEATQEKTKKDSGKDHATADASGKSKKGEKTQSGAAVEASTPGAEASAGASGAEASTGVNGVGLGASGAASSGDSGLTDENKTVVTDVSEVVESVMPSIVAINCKYTQTVEDYGDLYEETGEMYGSGIILEKTDQELLIVTNEHVIEDADALQVTFFDGTKAPANLKGYNDTLDLAVIAVNLQKLTEETEDQIQTATLGDSRILKIGEPAIAIGNAMGYGQSVTCGVISALGRKVELDDGETEQFIQTDAAVNPGNSGGALLNKKGEVIGINSAKVGGDSVDGIGFAIPISDVRDEIMQLSEQKTKFKVKAIDRGYLGLSAEDPSGIEGAYVSEVREKSAAEKAGLRTGDIITKVDDMEVDSVESLVRVMFYYHAGDEADVTVIRKETGGYAIREITVTLLNAKASGITIHSEEADPGDTADRNGKAGDDMESYFGSGEDDGDGADYDEEDAPDDTLKSLQFRNGRRKEHLKSGSLQKKAVKNRGKNGRSF